MRVIGEQNHAIAIGYHMEYCNTKSIGSREVYNSEGHFKAYTEQAELFLVEHDINEIPNTAATLCATVERQNFELLKNLSSPKKEIVDTLEKHYCQMPLRQSSEVAQK